MPDPVQNDSRLTGASHPVIFSDGTELNLSPLSDKDITELDNWIRFRYLSIARLNIPEDLSDEEKDREIRIAQQTAATLCWYIGYGATMMASIDGLCKILHQSAKKCHPKITYDEVHEKLLSQESNEKFANDAVEGILKSSFPDTKNSEDNSDKKNPTNHRNRRQKDMKTKRKSIVD